VHIVTTRRQYKDKEHVAHLLRRSFREDGKVKAALFPGGRQGEKRDLGQPLGPSPAGIEALRAVLSGETLVGASEVVEVERSLPHGHVAAAWAMAQKLGLARLLGPACAETDLALARVVARALRPGSKLATTRWWRATTIAEDLGVAAASADQVYAAMDWLVARQASIEEALPRRHLAPGARCSTSCPAPG